MDVAHDHRPGHIGFTPQPLYDMQPSSRIAGMLEDFGEHLEPKPRVDDYLPLPPVEQVAPGGYFRNETLDLEITGAVRRMQPGVMRQIPDAKTISGYDPLTDG